MGESRKLEFLAAKSAVHVPEMSWAQSWEDTVKSMEVEVSKGLHAEELRKRRQLFGQNMLSQVKPKSSFSILINQFRNLIVFFLVAAASVAFMFGDYVEGFAIWHRYFYQCRNRVCNGT